MEKKLEEEKRNVHEKRRKESIEGKEGSYIEMESKRKEDGQVYPIIMPLFSVYGL